jgi:hypothetical protein
MNHGDDLICLNKGQADQYCPKDVSKLYYHYDSKKIEQKRQEVELKLNALYHRLAHQDTVSSSRIKSNPQTEKILSTYEKKMIAEEKARKYAQHQKSASVDTREVFDRLMNRASETALKNQMMVAKLLNEYSLRNKIGGYHVKK